MKHWKAILIIAGIIAFGILLFVDWIKALLIGVLILGIKWALGKINDEQKE